MINSSEIVWHQVEHNCTLEAETLWYLTNTIWSLMQQAASFWNMSYLTIPLYICSWNSVIEAHRQQLTKTEWTQGNTITVAHFYKLRARFTAAGSPLNASVWGRKWFGIGTYLMQQNSVNILFLINVNS